MSGLDKMKSRIFEEAEQSAAELLDQAKKDAEKIVKDAVEKAGADAEHIRVKAAADAKEYAKRADMNRKQALLAAKQDVIRSVLEDAYSQVMNMDDAAYFEMLGKMLDKYMLAQDGAICFSKRDLDRMPKSFAEKIDASAKAKGGKLVISEEARKIDGGFILVYGGIEENCTIKAVFDAKREELADVVKRQLFS